MKFGTIAILVLAGIWAATKLGSLNIETDMQDQFQKAVLLYQSEADEMDRLIPSAVDGCLSGQSAANFPNTEVEMPVFFKEFFVRYTEFMYQNVDFDEPAFLANINRFTRRNAGDFDRNISRLSTEQSSKLTTIIKNITKKPTLFFGCISRLTLERMNTNT